MSGSIGFEGLVARLDSPEPGVRRVAVHDLSVLDDPRIPGALIAHLTREKDEQTVVLVIRCLARTRMRRAMPVLLGLYQNPSTPVRIAHAAILAHDALAAG